MIFAWWMACLSDAYGAAYYRRKPALDDSDYDVDFYTVDAMHAHAESPADRHAHHGQMMKPDPREHLEVRARSLAHLPARFVRAVADAFRFRLWYVPATAPQSTRWQQRHKNSMTTS